MEGFNEHEEEGWNEEINHDDEEVEVADEDAEESYSEKIRRQFESDDPDLVELIIGEDHDYFRHAGDWERDGEIIGRNTHLKVLDISDSIREVAKEDVEKFFRGVANNRSIQKLIFCGCNLSGGELFSILIPFFKSNRNFEGLKIYWCDLGRDGVDLLASVLVEFDSLKEFEFSSFGDELQEPIQALAGHSSLKKLTLRCSPVGRNGCAAVANLLQDPNSKLTVLDLRDNNIDDEEAAVLATGLAGNSTLKDLDLSYNDGITVAGWCVIFAALQIPSCRLEKLTLGGNEIDDATAHSLSNTLTNTSTIRALDLCGNHNITIAGWRALFQFLHTPTCMLEELDICDNGFNHEVPISLANALISNMSLRSLNFGSNNEITIAGWHAIFASLQSPHSLLESLDLSWSGINDEVVNSLTKSLVNNNKLRELDLRGNGHITTTGFEAISTVLKNPRSALEKLDLSANSINDATAIALANSLSNNRKLKELLLGPEHAITINGWAAFSRVLCNTSSIMGTFHSNHTLQKLHKNEGLLPADIIPLLRLNHENSKCQAARLKIIKTHFSGSNVDLQPFIGLELQVLPRAIAWMGRDGGGERTTGTNGRSLLYQFLRTKPELLEGQHLEG